MQRLRESIKGAALKQRIVPASIVVVLVLAFLARVIDLNHVPGINGDEAWYGVQIQRFQASLPVIFRAPSDRLSTDVFLAALLAPVQLVTGPAIWVLRVPAVIAGVLTAGLAYAGLRSVWGRTVALSAALILATLPINVSYSRFGWDPSLLGPFLVLALVLAGRGRGLGAMLALAAGVLVHPTAVLALPAIVGLLVGVDRSAPDPARGRWRAAGRWLGVALLAAGLVELTRLLGGSKQTVTAQAVLQRITDPGQAWDFGTGLFSLFSGRSVYAYFVSSAEPPAVLLVLERAALVATLLVLAAGLGGAIGRRCWRDAGLLVGTVGSLVLLYVYSGIEAVLPEGGRYSVFAIPAVVLSFVLALKHSGLLLIAARRRWAGQPRLRWLRFGAGRSGTSVAVAGALALGITLLTITGAGYLQPLISRGSTTQQAFYTADVDPRQQVWQLVSAQSGGRAAVYCENWWICYPLEYFGGAGDGAPTITTLAIAGPQRLAGARGSDFVVTVTGSTLDRMAGERFRSGRAARSTAPRQWFVVDLRGRPTYTIYRL